MTPQPLPHLEPAGSLAWSLAQVARAQPEAPAVAGLTYGRLAVRAGAVAAALRAADFRPSLPVALLLEQGEDFITGLAGVLWAGGFFVPLEPRGPSARSRLMLEDSGAPLILTSEGLRDRAEEVAPGHPTLVLEAAGREAGRPDPFPVPGDSLAYVLYTSGSTGRPKGVMQSHRTVRHNVRRHAVPFGITATDRASLLYPCSVYGGLRDIFNALLSGASLHPFPLQELGVAPLGDWLQEQRITLYCSVATVFRQVAAAVGSQSFPHLRLAKLGGEAIYAADIQAFARGFGQHARLSCGLGATETGGVRQFFVDPGAVPLAGRRVPCGHAVEDMEVRILDPDGAELPPGREGEIAVRSRFLSPGYWRRPELSQRAFTAEPGDPGLRTYRMGDRGVLRADGHLVHRGRGDHQVKVHGNRVELGEVEAALLAMAGVREAAVVARTDAQGLTTLTGWVAGESLNAATLRRQMRATLPDAMVPARIQVRPQLPLLASGKPDRQALEASADRLSDPAESAAPGMETITDTATESAPLESRLAAVWSRILKRPVGPEEDFYAAGGDSLRLIHLMVQVEKAFGVRLPLSAALGAPTVSRMARLLERHLANPEESAASRAQEPDADAGSWLKVIPIRPEGSRRPLFFASPAGGTVLAYYRLAHSLGPERPVHGLQVGLPPGRSRAPDMNDVAAGLLEAIRQVQPEGPYHLGGWSYGGFVAYAMACRLAAAGEPVGTVAIVDSDPRLVGARLTPAFLARQTVLGVRLAWHARQLALGSLQMALIRRQGAGRSSWLRRRLQGLLGAEGLEDLATQDPRLAQLPHTPLRIGIAVSKHMMSIRRWKAPQAAVPVHLIRSQEAPASGRDMALWRQFTNDQVTVHEIPGNHFTLFTPPAVEALAAVLDTVMDGPTP